MFKIPKSISSNFESMQKDLQESIIEIVNNNEEHGTSEDIAILEENAKNMREFRAKVQELLQHMEKVL